MQQIRPKPSSLTLGIDASRNRSGGARAHIIGILGAGDPRHQGIASVHVWSYPSLLRELPDASWLVKHDPSALQKSVLNQIWWQRYGLRRELQMSGCHVLLSTDAGTVCRFTPSVVMSRDMLSFEEGEMQRYGLFTRARLRIFLLRHMQVQSLRSATGALFLTRYAADVIQRYSGRLKVVRIIPHGVDESFRLDKPPAQWPAARQPIRCVYVSNNDLYKHQWHVVRAIGCLRKRGHPIELKLVGGGGGKAAALLAQAIAETDPDGRFVSVIEAVPHRAVPCYLADADVFVFASSCENMPNTLLEGMSAGVPIACSKRGPMPEILRNGGVYFDPEDPGSIARAVEDLITNNTLRMAAVQRARALAAEYSWARCARETWQYLADVSQLPAHD